MIGSFEPTQEASSDSIICVRGHPVVRPFAVHAFWKRQNETRNRSLTFKNAFPPRETDQNFLKTPSRGGKWGKFSEKRLPAAGKGKNRSKNGFPRREGGKICWRSVSRHGKWGFFAEKRFPPREEHFQEAAVPAAGRMRPHRRPSSNFAGSRSCPRRANAHSRPKGLLLPAR